MIRYGAVFCRAVSASVVAATGVGATAEAKSIERATATAPEGSPNVLIFMPDQQCGSTVLPGSPVVKPHMDAFLKQSVAFNSAYCPAPHCCPSRTSFMSGLYPSEHGVYNNVSTDTAIQLNPYPETPFWGQWLRAAGYGMGYAGKLHVGRDITPESCGFDNLSALEQDRGLVGRSLQQWANTRDENTDAATRKPGEMLRPDWGNNLLYRTIPEGGKSFEDLPDYKIMQAGIAGMKRLAGTGTPWCVMISNSGAHDPYDAPKRFVDLYDPAKIELPASFEDTMDDKPRVYQRQRYEYWSQLSDD